VVESSNLLPIEPTDGGKGDVKFTMAFRTIKKRYEVNDLSNFIQVDMCKIVSNQI